MLIVLLCTIILTAWCIFIMDLDLFANVLGQITVGCSNTACWCLFKKLKMKLINKGAWSQPAQKIGILVAS